MAASEPTGKGRSKQTFVYPDTRPLLVGFLSIIAFCVAAGVGPERASLQFYSAAAQIIPLLLLVLAVEVGFFRLQPVPKAYRDSSLPRALLGMLPRGGHSTGSSPVYSVALWNRLGPLLVLAALVVGELAALEPLADRTAAGSTAPIVYGAIAAGLSAIVVVAALGVPAPVADRADTPP